MVAILQNTMFMTVQPKSWIWDFAQQIHADQVNCYKITAYL